VKHLTEDSGSEFYDRTDFQQATAKGTVMTPESIPGRLVPPEVSQLLPPLELVVDEKLDRDPVLVALRKAA
jgi:hypothetical protein